jgi:hypothetical protein
MIIACAAMLIGSGGPEYDVFPEAHRISIAASLNGNGEVFFSNLSFEEVGDEEEPTDRDTGPRNIRFDELL